MVTDTLGTSEASSTDELLVRHSECRRDIEERGSAERQGCCDTTTTSTSSTDEEFLRNDDGLIVSVNTQRDGRGDRSCDRMEPERSSSATKNVFSSRETSTKTAMMNARNVMLQEEMDGAGDERDGACDASGNKKGKGNVKELQEGKEEDERNGSIKAFIATGKGKGKGKVKKRPLRKEVLSSSAVVATLEHDQYESLDGEDDLMKDRPEEERELEEDELVNGACGFDGEGDGGGLGGGGEKDMDFLDEAEGLFLESLLAKELEDDDDDTNSSDNDDVNNGDNDSGGYSCSVGINERDQENHQKNEHEAGDILGHKKSTVIITEKRWDDASRGGGSGSGVEDGGGMAEAERIACALQEEEWLKSPPLSHTAMFGGKSAAMAAAASAQTTAVAVLRRIPPTTRSCLPCRGSGSCSGSSDGTGRGGGCASGGAAGFGVASACDGSTSNSNTSSSVLPQSKVRGVLVGSPCFAGTVLRTNDGAPLHDVDSGGSGDNGGVGVSIGTVSVPVQTSVMMTMSSSTMAEMSAAAAAAAAAAVGGGARGRRAGAGEWGDRHPDRCTLSKITRLSRGTGVAGGGGDVGDGARTAAAAVADTSILERAGPSVQRGPDSIERDGLCGSQLEQQQQQQHRQRLQPCGGGRFLPKKREREQLQRQHQHQFERAKKNVCSDAGGETRVDSGFVQGCVDDDRYNHDESDDRTGLVGAGIEAVGEGEAVGSCFCGLPLNEIPDEIAYKVARFTQLPRCVSVRFERIRVKIVRELVIAALESSVKIPGEKAEEIEAAIFALFGCCASKAYKAKARELSFNLRVGKNDPLRARVLSGMLAPGALVRMSSNELAPLAVRRERERIARRRIKEVTSSRDSPLHTVTERFTCPECSHEKTQYRTWRRKAIVDRVRVIVQCLQCRHSWEL